MVRLKKLALIKKCHGLRFWRKSKKRKKKKQKQRISPPSSFFNLRLSLLLNIQSNENNYERAEADKRKKNQKIIFNSKKVLQLY